VSAQLGHDGDQRIASELIDVTVPNAARAADYLNGGHTNFAADRKAAAALVESAPSIAAIPASARAFRRRVLRHLAADAGIRQFLDVGGGLAALGNTHGTAQAVDPACRIVYVESDPMMLDRTRAMVASAPGGLVACVEGDIADVNGIVAAAGDGEILDAAEPMAVLLLSTLDHVPAAADAAKVVAALMDPAPSGSYLAIYHLASDLDPSLGGALRLWNAIATVPIVLRSECEIAALVAGLDLVQPGLVPIDDWRPEESDPPAEPPVPIYGLVARKP
jgi:S-adenosyl methyltransferase